MRILILDTETNGTCEKSQIIQLGCILFDTNTNQSLASLELLLAGTQTDVTLKINKIRQESIDNTPFEVQESGKFMFRKMWDSCEYVMAHNVDFDKQMIERAQLQGIYTKTWIDSFDIKFPVTLSSKLSYIATDNGIPIPSELHTALADVYLLRDLLKKTPDVNEQIESLITMTESSFVVTPSENSFDKKDIYKANLFRWSGNDHPVYPKVWYRRILKSQVSDIPFRIKVIDNSPVHAKVTEGKVTPAETPSTPQPFILTVPPATVSNSQLEQIALYRKRLKQSKIDYIMTMNTKDNQVLSAREINLMKITLGDLITTHGFDKVSDMTMINMKSPDTWTRGERDGRINALIFDLADEQADGTDTTTTSQKLTRFQKMTNQELYLALTLPIIVNFKVLLEE